MQFRRLLAVFLAVSVLTYAQGNTFTKVRYNAEVFLRLLSLTTGTTNSQSILSPFLFS